MDSVRLWFRQAPTCHGVSEWPGGLRRRMYLPRARRLAGVFIRGDGSKKWNLYIYILCIIRQKGT